jgi:hypothetical protein
MKQRFSIRKMPKKFQKKYVTVTTLFFATATLLVLIYLFLANGSILLRLAFSILILVVSGHLIATVNGLNNSYGVYLLGGKGGIKFIDKISKSHKKLWIMFSDWGLAFSFGILAHFMFKKQISKKMLAFGIFSIIIVLVFVYSYLPLVLAFINIPQVTSGISSAQSQSVNLFYYAIFFVACVIGGFSLVTMVVFIFDSGVTVLAAFESIKCFLQANPGCQSILAQQVPGIAPVIPGITIPLFSGIIAFESWSLSMSSLTALLQG